MSDTVVNLEEVSSSGRPYLKGQFSIRCIKAEKKTSRKNNPMVEFTWEFVAPETVTGSDGKTIKVPGLQVMDWAILGENGLPKFKTLHKVCHLPMTLSLSAPNVRAYLGKAVKASIISEIQVQKDDNTGEPVLDEEGKPVTSNQYRIVRLNSPDDQFTIPSDNVAF